MSSWVSHFAYAPEALTVLGMNADELAANPQARAWVVHDLNADPVLPFADDSFDHATCCVSVDYLTRRSPCSATSRACVRSGGLFRHVLEPLFPDQGDPRLAVLRSDAHQQIVADYFAAAGGFEPPVVRRCATPPGGDPLYAVWARVR